MRSKNRPAQRQPISERLLAPLREVSLRQRKMLALKGAIQCLIVALGVVLPVALLFGYFQDMPRTLRLLIALATWAVVLIALARFLAPALRRRSLARAALQVEDSLPGAEERISSAVELGQETDLRFTGSPALVAHLIKQAEDDAQRVDPLAVVPFRQLVRWAYCLAPVVLLWVVLIPTAPKTVLGGLTWVLLPWKSHLPALLCKVAVAPGDVAIAEGDPFEMTATISSDSGGGGDVRRGSLIRRDAKGESRAADLEKIASRQFKATVDAVREGFDYRVSTDVGDSGWYSVSVYPRPAVASLDLHYDYPPYTRIGPKDEKDKDGAIEAIVGTQVTLTIHGTGGIDPAASYLLLNEGRRDESKISLKPLSGADFQAKIPSVQSSGAYTIRLVDVHGIRSKDELPRTITARFDSAPTIAITSPAPTATARPDDEVPILFQAHDDFAIARIDALISVDDKPARTVPIELPPMRQANIDPRSAEGEYLLSVPEQLRSLAAAEAQKISYQLKVTDNRDPDPQSGMSARQVLTIDRAQPQKYVERDDLQKAQTLKAAIQQSIDRLTAAEAPVNATKAIDPARALTPPEKLAASAAKDQLATASKDLAKAADENVKNAFGDLAEEARTIAENPMRQAAENMAAAALKSQTPQPRVQAATAAAEQLVAARKDLQELLKRVDATAAERDVARRVEDVAKGEQKLAAEKPNDDEIKPADPKRVAELAARQAAITARQAELTAQLAAAVAKSEALRDPKAVAQAQQMAALAKRVHDMQLLRKPLDEQTQKHGRALEVQKASDALVRQQRDLNEKIEQFAQQQKDPLQKSAATAPPLAQQQSIVAHLQQNDPAGAEAAMKAAAAQLEQAAKALEAHAAAPALKPNAAEQAAQQAHQAAQAAAQQAAAQLPALKSVAQQAQAAQQAAQKADAAAQAAKQAANEAAERAKSILPRAVGGPALQAAQTGAEQTKLAAEQAQKASEAAKQAEQTAAKTAEPQEKQVALAVLRQAQAASEDATEQMQKAGEAKSEPAQKAAKEAGELAHEAEKEAQAAKDAADKDQHAQAAEQLEKAVKSLQAAAEQNTKAEQAAALARQQMNAKEAASQAGELAQAQQKLQEAAAEKAKQLAPDLARQDPAQMAAQETQLAQQSQQAAQTAQELAAQSKPDAPKLAERADAAKEALQKADQAEQQAAKAEQEMAAAQQQATDAHKQAQTAQQQANTAEQQAQAAQEQAVLAQRQAELSKKAEQHAEQQAADATELKNEPAAVAAKQQAAAAKAAGEAAQKQAETARQQAEQAHAQAQKSREEMAKAEEQLDKQHAQFAEARNHADEQQAQANQDFVKAQAALRNLPELARLGAKPAAKPGDPSAKAANADVKADEAAAKAPDASAKPVEAAAKSPDDSAQLASARTTPENGKPDGADPGAQDSDPEQSKDDASATPQEQMQQAARQVQEGVQAQQQAAQNLPNATEQAAKALAEASRNLNRATPGARSSLRSAKSDQREKANASASKDSKPDGKDASAAKDPSAPKNGDSPREGTAIVVGPDADNRPRDVEELGIGAADWAKLAPLVQQELLNAAQQSGPPAYREMIKNYYVRVARLESSERPAAVAQPPAPPK